MSGYLVCSIRVHLHEVTVQLEYSIHLPIMQLPIMPKIMLT